MTNCCSKHTIRSQLIAIRNAITPARREQAKDVLFKQLYPHLNAFHSILSFCSLPQEIELSLLNERLASEGRLILPKVDKERLDLFHIIDLSKQLERSSWNCMEPIPQRCEAHLLDSIDCALVPALGFDSTLQRIGYGKGYYDKLIAEAKKLSFTTHFIGIGFHEQLSEPLPVESHDMPVDELLLF
jgi:5-formyltetrahydrofolate cyclo-ligase